ncbi:MAG TPA: helix-turn-helix domain-containing protein [Solirubrobacteraceae bacterium]|nr:helix-turn-helix domain-containing protein [Solirubrobacteraceae bacterium]
MASRANKRSGSPRPALSARRALTVLSFLAAHPAQEFTISELVERLEINISSLHSVLAVLCEEGYLDRDPKRRTYRLGTTPIAVGQSALEEHPTIVLAREATAELAGELGVEAICGIIASQDLLTIAEAGRPERLMMRPRVGQRLPFMPPLGILGAGYLDAQAVEAWIDRLGADVEKPARKAYREAAAAAALRGYQVELETPTRRQIGPLLPALDLNPRDPALRAKLRELVIALGHERHTLIDPQAAETYEINNIQAPVFDTGGRFLAGLTLLGWDEPLSGSQVLDLVHTLTRAAERVTVAGGGHRPVSV